MNIIIVRITAVIFPLLKEFTGSFLISIPDL